MFPACVAYIFKSPPRVSLVRIIVLTLIQDIYILIVFMFERDDILKLMDTKTEQTTQGGVVEFD